MPYKRCDPVTEEIMKVDKYIGELTVFEKFRELWRIGKEMNHEILKYTARLAFAMAYRMHRKLMEESEYKASGENQDGKTTRQIIHPAEIEDMKKMRWLGHFQVCEQCRVMWRIGRELGCNKIMDKAREAMSMTKMMHEEMKRYKELRER